MISRRAFVAAVVGGLLGTASAARAQPAPKVHRVGFIAGAASAAEMIGPNPAAPTLRAFLQGMSDLGYVEGHNLIIERRSAEARFERVGGIVAELIRSKVDVIVATGHGTALAAKAATLAVPVVVVTSSSDPAALADRALVADLATRALLPSSCAFREQVEAGGLMSYGGNLADVVRRAAGYVDKILRGAKPADLPVEQPTKFELVVNRTTAKTLALTIPQALLVQADQILE